MTSTGNASSCWWWENPFFYPATFTYPRNRPCNRVVKDLCGTEVWNSVIALQEEKDRSCMFADELAKMEVKYKEQLKTNENLKLQLASEEDRYKVGEAGARAVFEAGPFLDLCVFTSVYCWWSSGTKLWCYRFPRTQSLWQCCLWAGRSVRPRFTAVYVGLWWRATLGSEESSPVAWLMLCLDQIRQIFA